MVSAYIFLCSGFETGCSILHSLVFGEKTVRYTIQQIVSIVEAIYHITMCHHLCGFPIQEIPNSAYSVEMEACHAIYVLNVVLRA